MSNILARFVQDEHTKAAVHNYLVDYLTEMAVLRVFNKQPVGDIAEAKQVIDEALAQMEREFSPPTQPSTINPAR